MISPEEKIILHSTVKGLFPEKMTTCVEVKMRSLKDQTLFTGIERYALSRGEVFVGIFKNEAIIDSFVELGVLEDVDESVPVQKAVPVIPQGSTVPTKLVTESGEELPLSGGIN